LLLFQLTGSRSNGIPLRRIIPSVHTLSSNTILHSKEPGLLGEMTGSGWGRKYTRWTGAIQMTEVRKYYTTQQNNERVMSNEHK
jgi:hypothetical protein